LAVRNIFSVYIEDCNDISDKKICRFVWQTDAVTKVTEKIKHKKILKKVPNT